MPSSFTPAILSRRWAVCLWLVVLSLSALFAARIVQPDDALVAHEWGTLTSVADEDGNPVNWMPLSGPSDLPCFVNRLGGRNIKVSRGTVRMETPVLYFYASHPMTLSVKVAFPQGLITEWYPQATRVQPDGAAIKSGQFGNSNGEIEWDSVEVRPGERPELPVEQSASHYYAARETDSAPIRVGRQQEKLIFYRGMGDFFVPLQPKLDGKNELEIRNAGPDPVALTILFENRGGKAGYRVARNLKDSLTLDMPELTGNLDTLRQEIVEVLIAQGLYPKEARAMVETWRDSWFEEGTRLFYIVPRAIVDSMLPLTIAPTPKQTARVFVGRIEILSPWMQKNIDAALATGDAPALEKYGRFLQPFMDQKQGDLLLSPRASAFLQAAYIRLDKEFNSQACVR